MHSLFPYPARVIRQIPRHLLSDSAITSGVARVIDPFCGSGTILHEAQMAGLASVGIEQNPVAALVSRVKVRPPHPEEFKRAAANVLVEAKRRRDVNDLPRSVNSWFADGDLSRLMRLRASIRDQDIDGETEDALLVALALATRSAALVDPRIPVPVRPRNGVTRHLSGVYAGWEAQIRRIAANITRTRFAQLASSSVIEGDARSIEAWENIHGAIPSMVFTSPPYGTAQKYLRSTSLELAVLSGSGYRGIAELQRSSIGRERIRGVDAEASRLWRSTEFVEEHLRRIEEADVGRERAYRAYFHDMQQVLNRIVSPEVACRRIVLVAGSNRVAGNYLPTYALLRDMVEEQGFRRIRSMRDEIRGRSLLTLRRGRGAPATHEWVEVFERNG